MRGASNRLVLTWSKIHISSVHISCSCHGSDIHWPELVVTTIWHSYVALIVMVINDFGKKDEYCVVNLRPDRHHHPQHHHQHHRRCHHPHHLCRRPLPVSWPLLRTARAGQTESGKQVTILISHSNPYDDDDDHLQNHHHHQESRNQNLPLSSISLWWWLQPCWS